MNQINEDFLQACVDGDIEKAASLIEKGVDIHAERGEALRIARRNGHTDIVKLLNKNGGEKMKKMNKKFIQACEDKDSVLRKFLAKKGAKLMHCPNDLISDACHERNLEFVKFLIKKGVKIS